MHTPGGFLNRSVPFVDAVLRSIEEEEALNRAATLLYEAEERYGLAFADAPGIIRASWAPGDDWSRQILQPFLTKTHLLLTGSDCQRLLLYDCQGKDCGYSWRHWGAEMAEWANRHVSMLDGGKPWDYLTFYSADYLPVDDYSSWVEAVMAVIRRKTAIYGWTFAPQITPYSASEFRKSLWWRGQIEIVQGQALPSVAPANEETKVIAARFGERLNEFVLSNQVGRFYPEGTLFVVGSAPDTVLSPLCAFISRQRKPLKSRVGWITMVPDMVFEARSQIDVNRRLDEKVVWWLKAGVAVVWVLDASMRQFTIYSQDKAPFIISSHEFLHGGEILPGFELPVESLFS